jgi:hypothetical protein
VDVAAVNFTVNTDDVILTSVVLVAVFALTGVAVVAAAAL